MIALTPPSWARANWSVRLQLSRRDRSEPPSRAAPRKILKFLRTHTIAKKVRTKTKSASRFWSSSSRDLMTLSMKCENLSLRLSHLNSGEEYPRWFQTSLMNALRMRSTYCTALTARSLSVNFASSKAVQRNIHRIVRMKPGLAILLTCHSMWFDVFKSNTTKLNCSRINSMSSWQQTLFRERTLTFEEPQLVTLPRLTPKSTGKDAIWSKTSSSNWEHWSIKFN